MSDELLQTAKKVIDGTEYMTIATSTKNGKIWNTPVYAVHDEKLNFFWSSWISATHSKNILENESTFIVIYDTNRRRGDNYRKGVYIEAVATELNDAQDLEYALRYFTGLNGAELTPEDFLGDSVKRLYKAVPKRMWLNDKSESQVTKDTLDMRIEIPLNN